jgi:hypothetical protein
MNMMAWFFFSTMNAFFASNCFQRRTFVMSTDDEALRGGTCPSPAQQHEQHHLASMRPCLLRSWG